MGLLEKAESFATKTSGKRPQGSWVIGEKTGKGKRYNKDNGKGLLERAIDILSSESGYAGEVSIEESEEMASRGLLDKAEAILAESEKIGKEPAEKTKSYKLEFTVPNETKEEAEEEYPGLLQKAEGYASGLEVSEEALVREKKPGLLQKAERYASWTEITEKAEIGEEKPGLLEKAELYESKAEIGEEKQGLLNRAELYKKEPEVFEEETEVLEPTEVEEEGEKVLERAEEFFEKEPEEKSLLETAESALEEEISKELFPEKLEKPETFQTVSEGEVSKAGIEEQVSEARSEEQVSRAGKEEEKEEEIEQKKGEKEEIEEAKTVEIGPETPSKEAIKEYAVEDFTYEKIAWYQALLSEKGYTGLFEQILMDIKNEIGANFCGLYIFEERVFELKAFVLDETIEVSPFKKSFRLKKNIKDSIIRQHQKPVEVKTLLRKIEKSDSGQFNGYKEWFILPLVSEETLWGFILLENIADVSIFYDNERDKKGFPEPRIIKLLTIASVFVSGFCSLQKLEKKTKKLNRKTEELSERLDDIASREKLKTIDGMLELISKELKISVFALFLVGEDKKPLLIKQIGLNEETIKNYRISLRNKEMKSIIKSGEPGVLQDEQKKVKSIFKKQEPENKRFIIIPINFGGDTLGILIINEIGIPGKKIPSNLKKRMNILTGGLVPFLIEERLSRREPYQVVEDWVKKHISRAKHLKRKLGLFIFRIDGIKKVKENIGDTKLKKALDDCGREIKLRFSTPDRVARLTPGRWVGVCEIADKKEVRALAGSIQEKVKDLMVKRKLGDLKLKYQFFLYPTDFKDEKKLMLLLG